MKQPYFRGENDRIIANAASSKNTIPRNGFVIAIPFLL